MTAIATLDRAHLKRVSHEGATIRNLQDIEKEKKCRVDIYQEAETMHHCQLALAVDGIAKTAADGRRLYYDIPILENESQECQWNHIHIFDDGRRWIDSVSGRSTVTSNLSSAFKEGVIHNDTETRNFDRWDKKRLLAWMVAKKLARTFLQQKLNVELFFAGVHITTEYQQRIKYKSSLVKIYLLRISWD